jgi:ribosome-binding factor A
MASQRIRRVQNLLRSEISTLLQRKIKDPRIGMVTITHVEADADLRHARVYVSIYEEASAESSSLEGLRSGAGFIRAELMRVLHLRPMPFLDFRVDDSLADGSRTLDLLDQIQNEQEDTSPRPEAGGSTDSK